MQKKKVRPVRAWIFQRDPNFRPQWGQRTPRSPGFTGTASFRRSSQHRPHTATEESGASSSLKCA